MALTLLSQASYNQLHQFHTDFWKDSKIVTFSSLTGAFIIITSLVVVVSAGLCLSLPGVNVVSTFVLPGLVPCLVALPIASCLIALSFYYRKKMKTVQDGWIQLIQTEVETSAQNKSDRKTILKEMLQTEGTGNVLFKKHLLDTLKKVYPPKPSAQTDPQKKVIKAINEVTKELLKS